MAKRPKQQRSTSDKPKAVRGRTGVVNEAIEERRRPRNRTDEVKMWEARLDLGKREAEDYLLDFAKNAAAYVGQPWSEIGGRNDVVIAALKQYTISVNRILPSVASQNAQIMPRIPWFRLNATKPLGDDLLQMQSAEALLNNILRSDKMNYMMHARLMLLCGQMAIGYMKVGYAPEMGIDPDEDKTAQYGEFETTVDDEGNLRADITGGTPAINPNTGEMILRGRNKFLLDNRNPADYFLNNWVDWRDMIHDPEGGNDPSDHSWIMQRASWTLEDFKANQLFRGVDKRDIEYAAYSLLQDPKQKAKRLDAGESNRSRTWGQDYSNPELDMMRIWGYEVWDIRNREILYLVDGLDKVAAKFEYPGWVDVSPYSILKFNEVPGEFYPYPEITPSRALSKAYNLFWSMLLNHLRRFNRKYVAEQNLFADPKEREAFKDPEDGVVIEVTNVHGIVPVLDAPLDPAIYEMMNQAISDQSEIMGSAPEARGIAQADSATQAALIDRRSTSREGDKRSTFGIALKHNAKIMLDCIQANLDAPMAFRIVGPDGQTWENSLSRADIIGDFGINIDLTELEPHDIAQEKRDATALVQILTPPVAFLSPTFTKKFFSIWNWQDPDIAKEFTEIALFMAAGGPAAVQGAGGGGAEGGGSPAKGGAKPPGQGPENGNTTEGRSAGRAARGRGEAPTLLGPGNVQPGKAA